MTSMSGCITPTAETVQGDAGAVLERVFREGLLALDLGGKGSAAVPFRCFTAGLPTPTASV